MELTQDYIVSKFLLLLMVPSEDFRGTQLNNHSEREAPWPVAKVDGGSTETCPAAQ